jgi:hypothetical protein
MRLLVHYTKSLKIIKLIHPQLIEKDCQNVHINSTDQSNNLKNTSNPSPPMASPFTIYSKNKIYRNIIEISPILERYLFKIRDISQFRDIPFS